MKSNVLGLVAAVAGCLVGACAFAGLEESVDGVYPHLAMSNDEDECGTGAVVPWAGSLWVVTYGPHCPCGSSDKLYQITPDLKRVVRSESVGGTPANRLIHRETNQLLIGPYVIDATGKVRVVPPAKMPGRLTGAARHLVDPANLVYVATMDNGLYALDMNTLAVKTLQRDHNGVDGKIWGAPRRKGFPLTPDWDAAVDNVLPGSHTKGLCTGFGRIQLSNNGEYHPEALTNPWIPSGVLGDCAQDGTDQRVIRRCQFTDIATADGIFGNEHPETNPVWAFGWDAKSVILAVTTNGAAWAYYRLPKGSHCYDGAHGWNTEWPRIREAGLGDGNLLATMHGTFWRFPKDFSPARPNGIRPLSTYLKVIGDFCWWADAPNGGSIVFGCDDHARSEFLGTRKLKSDQPKNARSTSNLWFVKPDELTSFGPPSGEGWVWCREDVKAGDVSDPYLWEGYADRSFTFTDAAGKPVPHELVHEGDWVRVKALADARGVEAHFVYGPPKPATLPTLDEKRPFIDVADDKGRLFRFPNVNGDATVLCREVATERDLLYVGGVFYELPAENAGGFAALRPIALADEPVKDISVDRGLIVVNGRRRVLDSLWKNGTADAAHWLWRKWFAPVKDNGGLTIDSQVPAGNIILEKVVGDDVYVRQDVRDTMRNAWSWGWFYWGMRVKGAAGRTLTFHFTHGDVVGVRGPVVSTDRGKTFSYPLDGRSDKWSFTYTFAADADEVRFYECLPYVRADWDAFLARHAAARGSKLSAETLCRSRKGAEVPRARFGCIAKTPKHRIFLSARHHCNEATASWVLEGVAEAFLRDDALGRWLCENVELMMVPMVDYDGVQAGDQGKNRAPHDHNRDYSEFLYPETKAITEWIGSYAGGRLDAFVDVHCPWIREDLAVYTPWKDPKILPSAADEQRFSQLLEKLQEGTMRYRASDDLPFGQDWNKGVNYAQGWSAVIWACRRVKGLRIARSFEVPFATANGTVVTPESCRSFGRDVAKAFQALFETSTVRE